MAKIDEQITIVMREMARRRWAKTTPEERKNYAQFLVSTRKKKATPIKPVVPDTDQGAVLCFRCESGFHDRCLDNGNGLACYCKRTLKHDASDKNIGE